MEDIQYNKMGTIILGAGGLAREIASWNNKSTSKINVVGFMDDFYNPAQQNHYGLNVLGKISFDIFSEDQTAICGISDCNKKEELHHKILKTKTKFSSFIYDSCIIGDRSILGIGVVLFPNVLISCDVTIGDLVFINIGSQIGHDAIIRDYASIMPNVNIGGGAQIGKNVFIGSNAVILPGVIIPDNTIIGAGSVVIRTIKQPGTYFGNPAKKIF
ncbi:MAG: hypothetical protein RLZZ236_1579 [Bacteroidota bacterium]|jgi:sugar O-acyltransferase (sialic acid O-acetyltransferase NeuD family)